MAILHKAWDIPGFIPSGGDLELRQLGIALREGRLFLKRKDGSIVCVGSDTSQFATLAKLGQEIAALIEVVNQALAEHEHEISAVQGLSNELEQLAQTNQSLADAIESKANKEHSHEVLDISDLASVLDGKADEADVTQFIIQHLDQSLDPHPQYLKDSDFQTWLQTYSPTISSLPFLVVTGNAQNPIALRVTSTTQSGGFGGGAFVCDGGMSVAKNANFNGDVFPLKALRHMGDTLSFYGAPLVTKPIVNASKSNPVALSQALLAALKNLGLISDQTTV
jgi:hypothetical protein